MLKYYCANITLLEDEEKFEFWLENVTLQRREKVLRCKNRKDQQRSLLAEILLRYGLEKEGISYANIEFSKSPEGKPFMKSEEGIHFSISHAGDYVACLISDETVGVDIESLDKPVFRPEKEASLVSMAKKCLNGTEWELFQESADKAKLFMEYWTKKEAYSKCVGLGLKLDFSHIDTEKNRNDFWTIWTSDGYCVSIYRKSGAYDELTIEKVRAL